MIIYDYGDDQYNDNYDKKKEQKVDGIEGGGE